MIYLVSGSTASLRRLSPEQRKHFGFLFTPANGNRLPTIRALDLPWALDNGAYSGFDEKAFQRRLDSLARQPGCLFVCSPDVVGDAKATLTLFDWWCWSIRQSGLPVAFVGQDGAEELDLPWDCFDAWFIGGSTSWKLSQASADLCQEACQRDKWLHMGRVNSLRRLRAALDMGCDSVDGSSASMYGDKYLPTFVRWMRALSQERTLFQEDA